MHAAVDMCAALARPRKQAVRSVHCGVAAARDVPRSNKGMHTAHPSQHPTEQKKGGPRQKTRSLRVREFEPSRFALAVDAHPHLENMEETSTTSTLSMHSMSTRRRARSQSVSRDDDPST